MLNKTIGAVVTKTSQPVMRETKSGKMRIGKTTYSINVHFGKIPLDEILKNRVLSDLKRA